MTCGKDETNRKRGRQWPIVEKTKVFAPQIIILLLFCCANVKQINDRVFVDACN